MALNKKKSRRIHISGEDFRYIVSCSKESTDGNHRLNITIQSELYNGCKLVTDGLMSRDLWLDFPDFDGAIQWSNYPVIEPNHIEAIIKSALNAGWKFKEGGKTFNLKLTNERLT